MVRGRCASSFVVDRPLTDRDVKIKGGVQRDAITRFDLLQRIGEEKFRILRARLVHGGRKHQIRRHLNSVGHQIVGDTQYGKSGINKWLQKEFGFNRMFLHAARIQFPIPGSLERAEVLTTLFTAMQSPSVVVWGVVANVNA